MGGWADRGARLAARISLRHGDELIRGDVRERLIAPVGPNDDQRVHPRRRTESKVRARIDRRFEATRRHYLYELPAAWAGNNDLGADPCGVRAGASQGDGQKVVIGTVQVAGPIAVDRG